MSKENDKLGRIANGFVGFAFILVMVVVLSGIILAITPYDSTDNIEAAERSGLSLFTDDLTGCQYLKAGLFGGITPRIDGNGEHLGCGN